jgi:exopolysaccharide biosynthesis polyprenyl glycosylphosphotransferase
MSQLAARMGRNASERAVAGDSRASGLAPRRSRGLRRLLLAADVIAISTAALVALRFAHDVRLEALLACGAMLPVWVILLKSYGLYDRDDQRINHATVDELPSLFHVVLVGVLLQLAVLRLAGRPVDDAAPVTGVLGFALLIAGRAAVRRAARQMLPNERVMLVGDGSVARRFAEKVSEHPEYDLDLVGYVGKASAALEPLPHLGAVDEFSDVVRRAAVERVVVVGRDFDEGVVVDLLRSSRHLGVHVGLLPTVLDVAGPSLAVDDVAGMTVLGMRPPVLARSSRLLKRGMDLLLSTVLLVVLSPLIVLITAAIACSMGFPVIFVQERVGRNGRLFRMYKFRTMVRDADALEHELRERSEHPAWLLLQEDPRIMPLGRVLRGYSLDELPQLWNVVKGDMSLVGPRPMPPAVDEKIRGWQRHRLDLTPGITGLWQVLGRVNIPFEEMLTLDYLYVMNWSLWQDVRLLVHTLPAVARRRGAN